MSTADKLNKLLETKQAIKQAIINKGVEVADDTKFADYPSKISSIPMEGGDPYYEDFYNLRTNNGTNMAGLFAYCNVPELDLRNLDVSQVTDMSRMFTYCYSSVNIDGWDTSKVTNTNEMFYQFSGTVDISNLDFSNVASATSMFYYCNIDNIRGIGSIKNPKATSYNRMFSNVSGTLLDLSSWDVSHVTDISSMFNSFSVKKIDLTGWVTTNVTDMSSIFSCYNSVLEELIIPDWDMTNVTKSSSFFNTGTSYNKGLRYIDLSRSNDATIIKIASFLPTRTTTTFGTVLVPENTSQEAYDALVAKYWRPIGATITPAPTSCSIGADLDEIMPGKSTKVYFGSCEPWNADPSKVELVLLSDSSIATMTKDNEVISTGVVGNIEVAARLIDTQEVIGTKTISVSETDSYPNLVKFRAASPSTTATIITVNDSDKKLSSLIYDSITDIYSYDAGVPITNIKFNSYSNINELVKLNTSNVTAMNSMFYQCDDLTSIDISNFDTSNVTNMKYMFYQCDNLTSLDISNFDTTNVTNTDSMFSYCKKLHTLRLDNCNNDTINKIITSFGFPTNTIEGVTRTIYCKEENAAGLTPPTNWVFSYVTEEEPEVPVDPPAGDIPLYVPGEFRGNTEITEVITVVDESHTDLSYMFEGCNNLTSVNTQDWDVSNITTVDSMFSQIYGSNLATLDFSTWDTSNMTIMDSMFCYMQSDNLPKLDLSSFTTKKLQQAYNMFNWCNMLQELDIRNFELVHEDGTEAAISSMLEGCMSLHTLRLDNCSNATIRKIINESGMPQEPIYDYSISENINRKMYCKASEIGDLVAPNGWEFVTVE